MSRTEPLSQGREHLTESGSFRSDKYPWCLDGFLPLKISDKMAWPMLRAYADTRVTVDAEFSRDLHEALDSVGAPREVTKPLEEIARDCWETVSLHSSPARKEKLILDALKLAVGKERERAARDAELGDGISEALGNACRVHRGRIAALEAERDELKGIVDGTDFDPLMKANDDEWAIELRGMRSDRDAWRVKADRRWKVLSKHGTHSHECVAAYKIEQSTSGDDHTCICGFSEALSGEQEQGETKS